MNINDLSAEYKIRKLNDGDIEKIYELSVGNPMFYEYCPPYVTKESIQEDMTVLPPNTDQKNKYYIGYFMENKLIAVMDLIMNYPDNKTVFIGLFMLNHKYQGKGIGTKIIKDCSSCFQNMDYHYMRLAYAKGNIQSEKFWLKNAFLKTGEEVENDGYIAVVMQKELLSESL